MVTTIKITCDGVFIQSNSKLSPKSTGTTNSSETENKNENDKHLLTTTNNKISPIHVSSKLKANRYDLTAGDVYLCKQIVSKSSPTSISSKSSFRICRSTNSLTSNEQKLLLLQQSGGTAAGKNKSLSHNQRNCNNKRRTHHKLYHELFISKDSSSSECSSLASVDDAGQRGSIGSVAKSNNCFSGNVMARASPTVMVDEVKKAKSCIEFKRKSFPSKKLLESYCFYSETTTWGKQQQQQQHHQQSQTKKKVAALSIPKNPGLCSAVVTSSYDCGIVNLPKKTEDNHHHCQLQHHHQGEKRQQRSISTTPSRSNSSTSSSSSLQLPLKKTQEKFSPTSTNDSIRDVIDT